MQLNPSDPDTPRVGMNETADRILALKRELTEVHERLSEVEAESDRALMVEESAARKARSEIDERVGQEDRDARTRWREEQRSLERRREQRRERMLRVTGTMRHGLKERLAGERRRFKGELKAAQEKLAAEAARRRAPLDTRSRRWEALLPELSRYAEETEAAIRALAADHGVETEDSSPWAGEVPGNVHLDKTGEETAASIENALREMRRSRHWWCGSFARFGPYIAYHILVVFLGIAGLVLAVQLEAEPPYVAAVPGGVLVLFVLFRFIRRTMRKRYRLKAQDLLDTTRQAIQRLDKHAEVALKHLDTLHITLAERQEGKLRNAESKVRQAHRERSAPIRRRMEQLDRREERMEKRLNARHELRLEAIEAREKKAGESRHSERQSQLAEQDSGHEERRKTLEEKKVERSRDLVARREKALSRFTRFATAAEESYAATWRPWDEIDPKSLRLPPSYPAHVPFGRLHLELGDLLETPFDLPANLAFPNHGSLLVQYGGAEREAALRILMNTVLRVLVSFPPGKARLTILDPVGLGQSFSALMHLADRDEALVNGRIWTETLHIQHRLADLTKHIEKVIQNYLRNRYNAIAEYNEVAGELQEPFHFLVIADFPASFNEAAAEHLASIVNSGPRCGVYTLIAQDTRTELPPQVDIGRLRANGAVLVPDGDGFRVEREGADQAEFTAEEPPGAAEATALLDSVGRLSVDADRVEVPFDAVVPADEEIWSASTTKGVRVPIGRTGAERLQYLDLGRGTAQHALIAGRTGSGKSTLFHVMITTMSLWFSPDEIEFYLIDFKKGVEFKPFATYRTPHARVVAIESDREFGLSVLKAVDAELARRGDLFRHHGVQDLAAYRASGAEDIVPRTLVMIDEFQEFFTEDDAVARDAALLLDRFVRQGRAFGIHMVLGSQTLSGIYTLAKSTLGQMGVRISLQCDEADSYLILSEDNGVARLLSRPGEAIYNDMSGLIEGNSPFQVVWLPDDEEAVHLRRVAGRALTTPPATECETVVFEGNLPADLEANEELAALLSNGVPDGDADDRIWLGDPNAIKGPTEVRFMPASGSNLLIVGQRRDAAFAMMTSAIISLAGQHGPDDVRFVILDGGGHEPEFAEHFENLLVAVPHRVERHDLRAVPDAVVELAEHVKSREGREADGPAIYVFAFGLQRLRSLRRDDGYSMSFSADEPESTGEQFATVLTDGPPQNVHTIVWCDTMTNLSRVVDRRSMREFDIRILFQMSAADSSELIDSSAANLLGLHNALLATESMGTFEKFRPYAIPDGEVMRRLGGGVDA